MSYNKVITVNGDGGYHHVNPVKSRSGYAMTTSL